MIELLWVPYLNYVKISKACIEIYDKLVIELLWLPYLHYVKISRAYIAILQIDILLGDEMLWLLNTWNVCIMLRYQELTS